MRRRDRGDLPQGRTAESVRSSGQPTAIVVRGTQLTSTKLTPQHPVLVDQVRDGFPFPSVQPTGQHSEDHLQRRGVDHEPQLTSRVARQTSADLWNTWGGYHSGVLKNVQSRAGCSRRHKSSAFGFSRNFSTSRFSAVPISQPVAQIVQNCLYEAIT